MTEDTFKRIFINFSSEYIDDTGERVISYNKERQYKNDIEFISKQLHDKEIKKLQEKNTKLSFQLETLIQYFIAINVTKKLIDDILKKANQSPQSK